jgi:hypothetical protein
MAAAENPIDYLCRFLPAQDQILLRGSQEASMAAQA